MRDDIVTTPVVQRARTAMTRTKLSRPVTLAMQHGVLTRAQSLFDFGCGRGADVAHLASIGFTCSGWDPAFAPDNQRVPADVVNLGYVLNVIEDPSERVAVLQSAWNLAHHTLIVAVRPEWEISSVEGRAFGDGIFTSRGTFQKFFTHEEFLQLLLVGTGADPVVVAPGTAFVFKDAGRANDFRVSSVRRRPPVVRRTLTESRYSENRDVLEPLLWFFDQHGHLPAEADAHSDPRWTEICQRFGSIRAAFGLVKRATGEERWLEARKRAEEDLTVFLALMAFKGRPRWSDLSVELQLDVRALFGNYKAACNQADRLLFSLGDAEILDRALRQVSPGKVLPDAIYLHSSALPACSALVRLYEGCARALVGDVPGANIIKLSRKERRVSYMSYPMFDREGHPALRASLRIDLQSFSMKFRDYSMYENPPILHRKELLVGSDYPKRHLFERLSRAEERKGLLARSDIGTRRQWEAALGQSGLALRGHQLVKMKSQSET